MAATSTPNPFFPKNPHFNYILFPEEAKQKASCGFKKDESFDFLFRIERANNKRQTGLYSNYSYGCHVESYELYTTDFTSMTTNAECNVELEREILKLSEDIQARRQQLDDALRTYPYMTRFESICVRGSDSLRWYGKNFGFHLTLLIFVWIWWFSFMFEVIFLGPVYCFLDRNYVGPTQQQQEEWFETAICSHPEFDAEDLDNFVTDRLKDICSRLNAKFHTSLKTNTYQEQVEVASHDEAGSNGGHVKHHTKYYDEFLIVCEETELQLSTL